MDDLLDFVLEAHGALRRWPGVSALSAKLAVGWPFWRSSGSSGYSATGPWTSAPVASTPSSPRPRAPIPVSGAREISPWEDDGQWDGMSIIRAIEVPGQ